MGKREINANERQLAIGRLQTHNLYISIVVALREMIMCTLLNVYLASF